MLRIEIGPAAAQDAGAVRALLSRCSLPVDDVGDLAHFLVARKSGAVVGTAGLEPFGEAGLFRSLAVDPAERGKGIGKQLAEAMRAHARALGVGRLFLLTTDAEKYFASLGFSRVARDKLPPGILATRQLRDLCPASAVAMTRVP